MRSLLLAQAFLVALMLLSWVYAAIVYKHRIDGTAAFARFKRLSLVVCGLVNAALLVLWVINPTL